MVNFNPFGLLNAIIAEFQHVKNPEAILGNVCNFIGGQDFSGSKISVRIELGTNIYANTDFKPGFVIETGTVQLPNGHKLVVEVHSNGNVKNITDSIGSVTSDLANVLATIISGFFIQYQLSELTFVHVERQKELSSINRTAQVLKTRTSLDDSLQEICSFLPEAMQYPSLAMARIRYGINVYISDGFAESEWAIRSYFEVPDGENGSIEIYYSNLPQDDSVDPFLPEEYDLVNNLAELISGTATKATLQKLLASNTERLKELKGINATSEILKSSVTLEDALKQLCVVLPDSWQYPEQTAVRIRYDKYIFTSPNFEETPWRMVQYFDAPGKKNQTIEVFYLQEFPEADEGPFLNEERQLLNNLANLIAGSATRDIFNQLQYENSERLKELKAINQTSYIIENGSSVNETLQNICHVLPQSWQYPEFTVARITFERKEYVSANFSETLWFQKENFVTIDNNKGSIEVFYTKAFPLAHEGPFLTEEETFAAVFQPASHRQVCLPRHDEVQGEAHLVRGHPVRCLCARKRRLLFRKVHGRNLSVQPFLFAPHNRCIVG
jgi:hypothetical protein